MSISTPPPPKKKGMGCCGCGCLVLALLVILFLALVAGGGYLGHTEIVGLTSTTPVTVPSFDGGDDLYRSTQQKLADFDHDVKNHQAATIQLSGDEINTLIARNPDVVKNNIHVFVTLANNEARVQASLPTDGLSQGLIKGRYSNLDTSFEVNFDLSTKSILLTFHKIEFGDKTLLAPNSDNDKTTSASSFSQSVTLWYTSIFNQSMNQEIRNSPDGAALLDQAKSIEIKDGELVIQTQ